MTLGRKRKGSDEKLLLALACGATVEAATRQAGLSVRSVYRRLDDAAFQRRLRGLRAQMLERAGGMLTAAALESAKALLELQKPGVQDAVRLGAARAVLELGIKIRELVDIEQRLALVEEQIARAA